MLHEPMQLASSTAGWTHGGNYLFLECDNPPARVRALPHRRAAADGTLDEQRSSGASGGRPAAGIGYSMPRVAWTVLLDAFHGPDNLRPLETLLPAKLDSSAAAELPAFGYMGASLSEEPSWCGRYGRQLSDFARKSLICKYLRSKQPSCWKVRNLGRGRGRGGTPVGVEHCQGPLQLHATRSLQQHGVAGPQLRT